MKEKIKCDLIYLSGFLLVIFLISSVHADYTDKIREDILIKNEDLIYQNYDTSVVYADLISNINKSIPGVLSENLSLMSYVIKPGAKFSPDGILYHPEILYIIDGEASVIAGNDSILAKKGDAVYISANVTRLIENPGEKMLRFISCIGNNATITNNNLINSENNRTVTKSEEKSFVVNETDITPNLFVNNTTGENFSFYRLFHPLEEPLKISYDLGTVWIPSGGVIPDHYVDGHSQVVFFLSGSGYVSVACTKNPVQTDDILYVAPGAVMNISADEDLHFMIITFPFYRVEDDHSFADACIDD